MSKLASPITRGFTLIEIMIALSIFTLIGLASTAVMTTVIDSNELSEQRFDKLQMLQRAMLMIERDVMQATPRAIRIEGQQNQTVITGEKNVFDSQAYGLGFVRGGWLNPQLMLPRSTLQAVAYRLYDGNLERLYGNYVDNVSGYEPKVRLLMTDVEDFQVRFFVDEDKDPTDEDSWEESFTQGSLPIAISIIIVSKDFGEIQRKFLMSPG